MATMTQDVHTDVAGRGRSNDVIRTLLERRTTRRFEGRPIPQDLLDLLIACGNQAPSALGRRDPLLVTSTDATQNLQLGRINRCLATERERGLADHVSIEQPSIIDDPAIEDGFYGAPAMIYAFSPKGWDFAREDASIAADAMMVAAASLGLGTCYVSRAAETFATPTGRAWMSAHDVPDDFEGVFALAVGYPA